jgi:hypothetical protein
MTIWRMLIACGTPKATNTHSEYVILIAIWLHVRSTVLPYTCIVCLALCCSLMLYLDLHFSVLLLSFACYRILQDIFCIRPYFLTCAAIEPLFCTTFTEKSCRIVYMTIHHNLTLRLQICGASPPLFLHIS